MLAETRTYFRKLLAEDRGVDHLIASDFVVINQRLAELYGIRGVNGAEFRTVPVPTGSHRGGFLTQAAVLKVTANGQQHCLVGEIPIVVGAVVALPELHRVMQGMPAPEQVLQWMVDVSGLTVSLIGTLYRMAQVTSGDTVDAGRKA